MGQRPSRWPGAEEAAPPFPEAAPSAPSGSAPSSVPAVAAGGRRLTRPPNSATPAFLFSVLPGWDPLPQIFTTAGRSRGRRRRETARAPGLGPSPLSVAAPGSFPLSEIAGCAQGSGGWPHLEPPEDFPLGVSLVCPLSPPASPRPQRAVARVSTDVGPAALGAGCSELPLRTPPPATQIRSLHPSPAGEDQMLGI